MTPTHRIIQESSGIRFSRIVSFLYGSTADIAFFITILSVVCFVSGQVVPKTIDTGQQTCRRASASKTPGHNKCRSALSEVLIAASLMLLIW